MAKLYEIATGYNNLIALIESGELTKEEFKETLETLEGDFEEKAENIAKILKNTEGDIKAFREEENRLAERRRTLENASKRLKEYLELYMKMIDKPKFKKGTFSFNIQKNPPSVEITNADMIPSDYKTYTETLDKKAILQDLKDGKDVQGAILKQSESLRIK